jgi:hypothetical protein
MTANPPPDESPQHPPFNPPSAPQPPGPPQSPYGPQPPYTPPPPTTPYGSPQSAPGYGQQPPQGQWPSQPAGTPPYGGQPFGQQPPSAPGGTPSPGAQRGFDAKAIHPVDWAILACGFLAFIFSFVSYYSYTARATAGGLTLTSITAHWSAWHGFFGWFAAIVALAAAGMLAIALFAPQAQIPSAVRLLVLAGFALATLCVLIAWIIVPGKTSGLRELGVRIDKGHSIGFYLSLIVIIGGLLLSFLRLRATGGKLPWQTNR